MTITMNMIKNWQKGDDPDMLKIIEEEEQNVVQMFRDCVEEEKNWAEYLFRDGSRSSMLCFFSSSLSSSSFTS